jgi:hypothetical protein
LTNEREVVNVMLSKEPEVVITGKLHQFQSACHKKPLLASAQYLQIPTQFTKTNVLIDNPINRLLTIQTKRFVQAIIYEHETIITRNKDLVIKNM